MTLTSRQKRPLNRKIPHLRDTRLIIIATEGERTEKQYFESDLFRNLRVQILVLETVDGLSAPKHVLSRLKKYANKVQLQADDQLWLMVDKDRNRDEHLSAICADAKSLKINLAVSNPSFELWLFLHLDDWIGDSISSVDMKRLMRTKLGSYNESNIDMELFKNGVCSAIERARALDVNSSNRWPSNPGTHVYYVVEEIFKIMYR